MILRLDSNQKKLLTGGVKSLVLLFFISISFVFTGCPKEMVIKECNVHESRADRVACSKFCFDKYSGENQKKLLDACHVGQFGALSPDAHGDFVWLRSHCEAVFTAFNEQMACKSGVFAEEGRFAEKRPGSAKDGERENGNVRAY